jgi:hypothetical protein
MVIDDRVGRPGLASSDDRCALKKMALNVAGSWIDNGERWRAVNYDWHD